MRHSYDSRALLLHGSSGSGKSSLVRAGVYPKLKSMQESWTVVPLFKTTPTPFDDLLKVLSQSLIDVRVDRQLVADTIHEMSDASEQQLETAWEHVASLATGKDIVLIVDNLDRYFSFTNTQSERLLMLLGSAIRSRSADADRDRSRVHVIGILRSDQLHRVAHALNISSLDYDTFCVVHADPTTLMSSLNELLQEKGYVFDRDFIPTIYVDMGSSMEAWPVIGRYLNDLWGRTSNKRTAFQLANYERDGGIAALITGDLTTVETRLGKQAENFFDFLALEGVSHVEDEVVVPVPIPRARIPQEYKDAIKDLEEKCLVVAGVHGVTGEAAIEIVPAVIGKYWNRARIIDRVNAMEELREARRAAQQWELKSRHPEWLIHRGERLSRIRQLLEPRRLVDTELSDYLAECVKHLGR